MFHPNKDSSELNGNYFMRLSIVPTWGSAACRSCRSRTRGWGPRPGGGPAWTAPWWRTIFPGKIRSDWWWWGWWGRQGKSEILDHPEIMTSDMALVWWWSYLSLMFLHIIFIIERSYSILVDAHQRSKRRQSLLFRSIQYSITILSNFEQQEDTNYQDYR